MRVILVVLMIGSVLSQQQFTSLGLPRAGHCAISYNSTLYIFGGGNAGAYDLSLAFAHPIDLNAPVTQLLNVSNKNVSNLCVVTDSGQAIFLGPAWNRTLDLRTQQWTDIPSDADDSTLDNMAITTQQAVTMFQDQFIVIFGGENQGKLSQSTVIIDTSTPSFWSLQDIPATSKSPAPAAGTLLVSTARWVFHFATSVQNSTQGRPFDVKVHCFDPLMAEWIGQVGEFTSWSNQLQAVLVPNISSTSSESLLIVSTSSQPANTSHPPTGSIPPYDMWLFTVSGSETTPNTQVSWIAPPNTDIWRPLAGGTATLVESDLVVFYGGNGADAGQALQFWNATSRTFVQQPGWLQKASPVSTEPTQPAVAGNSRSTNKLAIILGSVLGGALFLLLLLLLLIILIRRKRKAKPQPPYHLPRPSPMALDSDHEQDVATWASQLRQSLSSIQPTPSVKARSEMSEFEPQHQDQVPPVPESRFKEHFDPPLLPASTSRTSLAQPKI